MSVLYCSKCGALVTRGREGKMHSGCPETIPGSLESPSTLAKLLAGTRHMLREKSAQAEGYLTDVRALEKRVKEMRAELDATAAVHREVKERLEREIAELRKRCGELIDAAVGNANRVAGELRARLAAADNAPSRQLEVLREMANAPPVEGRDFERMPLADSSTFEGRRAELERRERERAAGKPGGWTEGEPR